MAVEQTLWQRVKDDWPEVLCWGLTINIVVLGFCFPIANWIVTIFGLYQHEPKAVPWELFANLIFGLLGMKGLNIIEKKANPPNSASSP